MGGHTWDGVAVECLDVVVALWHALREDGEVRVGDRVPIPRDPGLGRVERVHGLGLAGRDVERGIVLLQARKARGELGAGAGRLSMRLLLRKLLMCGLSLRLLARWTKLGAEGAGG